MKTVQQTINFTKRKQKPRHIYRKVSRASATYIKNMAFPSFFYPPFEQFMTL